MRTVSSSLLVLLLAGCGREPATPNTDPRAAAVESTFGLAPPYTIDSSNTYLDGGSSQWVVRGARGRKLRFYWDGAMRAIPYPSDTLPRLLSLGGPPGMRSRDIVPLRSARESTLIVLLRLCAEGALDSATLSRADFVHRSGDAEGYWRLRASLDPEKQEALDAYSKALGLEAQRRRGYWRLPNESDSTWRSVGH